MISVPVEADGALAIGWATVELERAAAELAHLLAPGATFDDAPVSVILGARCRVGPSADRPDMRIVLLEPDTEGRLAATLARDGEGWVATWLSSAPADAEAQFDTGRQRPAPRPGPFGAERLLLGGPPAGPHRLVVEAVPSPP